MGVVTLGVTVSSQRATPAEHEKEASVPFLTAIKPSSSEVILYGRVTKSHVIGFGPGQTHEIDCGNPMSTQRSKIPLAPGEDAAGSGKALDKAADIRSDALVVGSPYSAEGKTVLKVRAVYIAQLPGSVVLTGVPKKAQVGFCYHNTMQWHSLQGDVSTGVAGRGKNAEQTTSEQKKLDDATDNGTSILFVGTPARCVESGYVVRGAVLGTDVTLRPVRP